MRLIQPPNTSKYDVKSTDTISSIALRYNTTPTELSRLNHLSSLLLYPGQTLFVPQKSNSNDKECKDTEKELVTIAKQPTESILISSPKKSASDMPEMTFSPDHGLESLLGKGCLHLTADEISTKYLKIKSKYVTDGQGVVSGVLLVTPQTIMFNPCVSDHLVIDRGRESYLVRLSLKVISRLTFFEDIAAMVVGDVTKQFIPSYNVIDYTSTRSLLPKPGTVIWKVTGEEYKLLSQEKDKSKLLSQEKDKSKLLSQEKDKGTDSKSTQQGIEESGIPPLQDKLLRVKQVSAGTKTENKKKDETSVDQGINSLSETVTDNTLTSVNSHVYKHNIDEPEDNHHNLSLFMEESHSSSTPKHTAKIVNSTDVISHNKHSLVENLPPDKIESANGVVFKPGKNKTLLSSPGSDLSKDSGISEMNTTNFSQQDSRDGDNSHPPLISRSSLSSEAKQWLGNRGIHLSSMDNGVEHTTVSKKEKISEEVLPRPASKYEDNFMYVAIKVHKNYWYSNRTKQNNVMGVPPNRDQKRRQHWFAIPKDRVDQFYAFLLHWAPDVGVLASNASSPRSEEFLDTEEGLNIIDDAFPNSPATLFGFEKLHSEDAADMKARVDSIRSYASKTSLRSLCDDESPDLLADSELLSKKQIRMLARRLPVRTVGHSWELVYSTHLHGISLATLYRNFQDYDTPAVIIVKDETQKLFGAFLSDPPRLSDGFFGNGESMLFTFNDENRLTPYNWSGENHFFIKGSKTSLIIGGGEGVFGLWLDEDLYRGRSHSCKTYANETLSGNEDFVCSGLEAWAFV